MSDLRKDMRIVATAGTTRMIGKTQYKPITRDVWLDRQARKEYCEVQYCNTHDPKPCTCKGSCACHWIQILTEDQAQDLIRDQLSGSIFENVPIPTHGPDQNPVTPIQPVGRAIPAVSVVLMPQFYDGLGPEATYLARRANPTNGYGLWACPGGKHDLGETLSDTARRECKEETGTEVEILAMLQVWDTIHTSGDNQFIDIFALARIQGGTVPQDREPDKFLIESCSKLCACSDRTTAKQWHLFTPKNIEILDAMGLLFGATRQAIRIAFENPIYRAEMELLKRAGWKSRPDGMYVHSFYGVHNRWYALSITTSLCDLTK